MNWKQNLMAIAHRLRIVGIIIFILILGAGAYEVYGILRESTGMNPSKTATAWFNALSQGDYATVYALTAKADLTDIYGRQITQGEFNQQLQRLTGSERLPITLVETKKLFETRGRMYYAVTLHSTLGGTERESRVVVEIRKENNNWVLTYPFGIIL
ncbi:MAG: NTF2-like N-terminal transpeptidase domain-containing protein [Anaerolineae bacterium]